MLVAEQHRDRGDAEPVERADRQACACDRKADDGERVKSPGAEEDPTLSESHRPGVEPLPPVVLEVVEGVEEVESRDPAEHRGAQRPCLPRRGPGYREPRADRGEPETGAEPEVAQPCEALEVRVDDEHRDGDRPEPPDDRVELEDGDEVHRERRCAQTDHLRARQRPARQLAARRFSGFSRRAPRRPVG